ncbi:MAG: hypothetical protein IJ466_12510, partial [Clostridia bacterium]|nr:hypothetical protein [Clostridia bacterium]
VMGKIAATSLNAYATWLTAVLPSQVILMLNGKDLLLYFEYHDSLNHHLLLYVVTKEKSR